MKRILAVALFVHFLSPFPSAAQSGTGAIGGIVQDSSGAVVPGVTVALVNAGTIGANQLAVTDERGAYELVRVVPGRYAIRAELSGFRTVVRENVIVNADVTARVDVTLELGDVAETITVTTEAPLIDTTSALNQTVLDVEMRAAIPSRTDMWSLARTVPSVTMNKYDVGGSEAYSDSDGVAHGAAETREGAQMIDGMEQGCSNSAGASHCQYLDPQGFQEVNVQVGNAPAESSRGGLVYNFVTRTGSNAFHGGFTVSGTNENFQADNISPELRDQLLAGVPPAALAANPDLQPGAKILHTYNISAYASGPIVRDKLWWVFTGDYGELDQLQVGNWDLNGNQVLDQNTRESWATKLSWQASSDHQLHWYHNMTAKKQFFRRGEDARAFQDSASLGRQVPNRKHNDSVRWTGVLSSQLLAEAGGNVQYGPIILLPQPSVKPGDLPRWDRVTNTYTVARNTYNENPQRRTYLQSSVSYVAGDHNLKFGYQLDRTEYRVREFSMSHYPSGLMAVFRSGVPDSVITYNTPTDSKTWINRHGFYAQDRWTLLRRLTISYGVRLEKVVGGMPEICQPQTPFVDAQCFAAIEQVPDFFDPSPRLAVIYDIAGDGRTALKATANRYLVGVGVDHINRINPLRLTSATRAWVDRNGDLLPQLEELGPSSGFDFGSRNRYSEDTERPTATELSVGLERQLPGNVAASVSYYHRRIRNDIGSRNVAVPRESYIPIPVTERVTGLPVTVYNQDPTLRGKFDVVWDNYPELDSDYDGVDVTVRKRLSNRWMLLGGMNIGRNRGDIYGTADLNNPNFTFRPGVLTQDVPFSFKMTGLYELPYQVSLSGSVQYLRGFPERDTVSVGSDTVALTQVTQSLVVAPSGTNRLPSVNLIDLSIRRTFRRSEGRMSIEPVLDLFNIANVNTVTFRSTQLGPAYHRAQGIVPGRMLKFGVNITY